MVRRFLTGFVCAALASTAVAGKPKSDPREAIAKAIQSSMDGDPEPLSVKTLKSAMKRVDLDGDKIADWQVDWEKFGSAAWCGTGGCRYQLWRGREAGPPVMVFDRHVREVSRRKTPAGTVFDFDFHGSVCGGFGVEACPASFGWDNMIVRLIERPTRSGDGTIRMMSPYENFESKAPSPVLARVAARKAMCTTMGAEVGDYSDEYFAPLSVPDVDGDGVRDWLLHGSSCVFKDDRDSVDLPDELIATAGDPARGVMALSAAMIRISVATRPATVSSVKPGEECETYSTQPDAKLCPVTSFKWDAAGKVLVAQ